MKKHAHSFLGATIHAVSTVASAVFASVSAAALLPQTGCFTTFSFSRNN